MCFECDIKKENIMIEESNKENLLACSSGGRTSMFQLEWLLENKHDEFNIVGVFANTGWEHPKTIEFVNNCAVRWKDKFNFDLVWVEAVVNKGRVACTHKTVNYETAARNKEPLIEVIKKYGIPNSAYPHCTRELKENPIHSYIKSIGWIKGEYKTALGIRIDEPKRIKYNETAQNKVYPLVDWHPDKPDKLGILDWWEEQDFDLGIPEHLGNCIGCFRKSQKKTLKVIRDEPDLFDNTMEIDFGHIGLNKINGEHSDKPRTMYRQYHTSQSLIALFKQTPAEYLKGDEPEYMNEGCASSCEPFA